MFHLKLDQLLWLQFYSVSCSLVVRFIEDCWLHWRGKSRGRSDDDAGMGGVFHEYWATKSSQCLELGVDWNEVVMFSWLTHSADTISFLFNCTFLLLLLLVWHAPLGVRSAKRRHKSPEWMILSHSYHLIQGEIVCTFTARQLNWLFYCCLLISVSLSYVTPTSPVVSNQWVLVSGSDLAEMGIPLGDGVG